MTLNNKYCFSEGSTLIILVVTLISLISVFQLHESVALSNFQSKIPSDIVTGTDFANDVTKPKIYEIATVPAATDTTPPKIISVFPANKATNVPTILDITVKFNEPMQVSTLSGATIKLKDNFNNIIPAMIRSPDTDTVVIRPSSPLLPSKLYSVIVTQGVKDLAGNAMSTPVKWIFSTTQTSGDTPSPTEPEGKHILSDAQKKLLQGAGGPPSSQREQATTDKSNIPTYVYLILHFDSVDIINEHEGLLSGDGEYDLWAEAGKGMNPTELEQHIDLNAHAVADGLWDVSSHERVPFEDYINHYYYYQKSDLTKDSNFRIAFHLKTYGYEVDGCGRMYGSGGETAKGFYQCNLVGDDNDRLGNIKFSQTFDWPTEIGESGKKVYPFHISSSSGDYRLNFRITIEAPTPPKS